MDKRTVSSAHLRIDGLEKDVIALQTEVRIQFKEVFNRIKRIEAILLSASGATILMLSAILTKMG